MKMAGPFAPPILSFTKRENAPCSVEERKWGRAGSTSGFTNVFYSRRSTGGSWAADVWTVRPSSLPLTWYKLEIRPHRVFYR